MDKDTVIQSSFYNISSMDFPQGDDYLSDIELITMSSTGILDAQVVNMTLNESCMMLVNAIKVFRLGFFDCAFFSLRQTIELSISGIYLYSNKEKLKDWNRGEDGFEKGRMAQLLKHNDYTFNNIHEKLSFYYEALRETERHIDKYVHKQGVVTFYTYHGRTPDYHLKHKQKITKDFETYLKDCIGAVLVYRLVIDPLPLLLSDEEIAYRSPDFITAPFSQSLVKKYLGEKIINAYKQTDIYKGYYENLSCREKQNDAVYDLIHWQLINRNFMDDYVNQVHLLSYYDRLALIIVFASSKVSNCYLMNGFSWYTTDTKSHRNASSIVYGDEFYKKCFPDDTNYNMHFENVFISRCNAFGETHYFEHNSLLNEQEIYIIEHGVNELNKNFIETNKTLEKWYEEHIKIQKKSQ